MEEFIVNYELLENLKKLEELLNERFLYLLLILSANAINQSGWIKSPGLIPS